MSHFSITQGPDGMNATPRSTPEFSNLPANAKSAASAKDYDYQIYYRAWHNESPEHAKQMSWNFARLLGPIVKGREDGPVLDVGCGMGFALLGMKQLGFGDLRGLECDEGQVRSARAMGLNVDYVEDTIDALEQMPGQYRTVLLLDVLEHVPVDQQIRFLRALNGAMKDD